MRPRRRSGALAAPAAGVVLLAALAGCGAGGTARDDGTTLPSTSASPSSGAPTQGGPSVQPPGEPAPATVLRILHGTAAHGRVDGSVVPLTTPADVDAFVAQFGDHPLARDIRRAVRRAVVPPGMVLVGSVVALGCDVPTVVHVETGPLRLVAEPVASPHQECLAPVTSVALAIVDASVPE
ncbi:MAG: hypothetical protein R2731_06080 [Nocardioides sp.]